MIFGHAFHIHDVEFKLVSRSSGPVGAYESGWKDVLYLPRNESATFVARFADYSDPIHPFMYHCHFANHEDGGMMGQFVVTDNTTATTEVKPNAVDFTLYPNPSSDRIFIDFKDPSTEVYYITILNAIGRTIFMLPRPDWQDGIDISKLAPGMYSMQLIDEKTKQVTTKSFIKA
jgi:hypothetical protein